MREIISAEKETNLIAGNIMRYAEWCNEQAPKYQYDIKYYIREIIESSEQIVFFATAFSNTNAAAKEVFLDAYIRSLDVYWQDYVDIAYADSSTVRVSLPNR